jgi:DNA-binding CsgD family transcriptional regulator
VHSLRHRTARAADAENILETLRRPGDGYGPSSTVGLGPLLARLLEERALRGPLLESRSADESSHPAAIKAVAATGFVTLEQGRAWIAAPPPQLVDEVFARERAGDPVLLRPEQQAALNSGTGMALVFVAFRLAIADAAEAPTLIATMFDSFRLFHTGFHCPLALHPTGQSERGDHSIDALGFKPVGDGRCLRVLETATLEDRPFNPFIVLRRGAPPRLGFSPGEQELLLQALLGYTDPEIAQELHVSIETIRKRWRSAFERVAACEELAIFPRSEPDELKRGPEKRGAVLQYLDAHLEELRPNAAQLHRRAAE